MTIRHRFFSCLLLWLAAAAVFVLTVPAGAAQIAICDAGGAPLPHVRHVTITGNKKTRSRVILREMNLRPGAPFCADARQADESRILDLGLFSDVNVSAQSDSPDSVDLVVEVRERATFLPIPELGYSSEDGTTYGFTLRESNFMGDGQRLGATAIFGGDQTLSLSWTLPWFGYVHTGIFGSAFDNRHEDHIERLKERRRGVRLGANRFFDGYRYGLGIDAHVERVESNPQTGASATAVVRDDLVRSLALSASFDTRDFRTNPRSGWTFVARYEQFGSWLGGDVTLNRTTLGSTHFVPVSSFFTLALGAQTVLTRGSVPDYERTRLGGINTVRGFSEGFITGESRAWQSTELRFPIMRKRTFRLPILKNFDVEVAGAFFTDVGAIWEDGDVRRARGLLGVGTGVRIFMPFAGVSRTDVALGSNGGWRLRGDSGMKF